MIVKRRSKIESFGRFLESGRFPKGGALWSRPQARNTPAPTKKA